MNDLITRELQHGFYSVPKFNIRFFGSNFVLAGVWAELSQLESQGHYKNNDEWFRFTYEYIAKRMGITIYKVTQCIDSLKKAGLLECADKGMPAKLYYKIRYDIYNELANSFIISKETSTKFCNCETVVACNCEIKDSINITTNNINKESTSCSLKNKEQEDATVVAPRLIRRNQLDNERTEQSLPKEDDACLHDNNIQEAKPKLVRRKPSIFPSTEVEILFKYWNDLGTPLSAHKENPNNKTFQLACKHLAKACQKYSVEEIQSSMDKYQILLTSDTKLHLAAIGHKVGLAEFFQFSEFTNNKLIDNIKNGHPDDILDGIDGWFYECLQSIEELMVKFGNQPKYKTDNNPEVTKKIATLYREHINSNPLSPHEINMMIDTANDLVNFHSNMKEKINFNSCPYEKNSVISFTHHLIDTLLDMTEDKATIIVAWLRGKMFSERLPNRLKKLGILDSNYQGKSSDVNSNENKEQRLQEINECCKRFNDYRDELNKTDISEEEKKKLLEERAFTRDQERKVINLKYGITS